LGFSFSFCFTLLTILLQRNNVTIGATKKDTKDGNSAETVDTPAVSNGTSQTGKRARDPAETSDELHSGTSNNPADANKKARRSPQNTAATSVPTSHPIVTVAGDPVPAFNTPAPTASTSASASTVDDPCQPDWEIKLKAS
jgi:hypothetical protein